MKIGNRIISPSILSADINNIDKEIELVKKSEAEFIHIDVMDGRFVPAVTFSDETIKKVISLSDYLIKDVHIMVEEPWIIGEKIAKMGASIVTFHIEACPNDEYVRNTIKAIKTAGSKVGISIKPGTPVSKIQPYLDLIDLVLIMTVEPGKGGQSLLMDCVDKIKELSSVEDREFLIECDGGINDKTVGLVKDAGVDVIVAGSYLFGHADFVERVEVLLK